MKKLFMLALTLTIIGSAAFANSTEAINKKVLTSFSKAFLNAEDVRWEVRKDLYKATFRINDETMFAYYNKDGEQLALTRNIKPSQLPLTLYTALKQDYKQYWLTDLFEVYAKGETAYYATVHTSKHKIILKAVGASDWLVFKKDRK